VWDDDIDVADLEGPSTTDADFLPGGDAYDPSVPKSKKDKKRDPKGKLKAEPDAEIVEIANQVGDEQAEKALDEYYEMEYEDVVRLISTFYLSCYLFSYREHSRCV
jgi:hypothetical protein